MSIQVQGQVGPVVLNDGAPANIRMGKGGDVIVSELHGRFYESTYRGNTYTTGTTTVLSIAAATFAIATLGATATPIIGLWNPISSGINAVLSQAILSGIQTALACTGCAPFYWCVSSGNAATPSTGLVPYSRKTGLAKGSQCVGFAGQALTGITNNMTVVKGSPLYAGPPSSVANTYTVAGIPQGLATVENFDGDWIIPPGGVIALLSGTTALAISVGSGLTWEEVAV